MRYNNVIIIRITDFRRFFTFSEFWAYRNMYTHTTAREGFWNTVDRIDNQFLLACDNVVKYWICNKPCPYSLDEGKKLTCAGSIYGTYSEELVDSVNRFLDSYPELRMKNQCDLFLLSLYTLLDKYSNVNQFEADKKDIAKILLNENSDFTKEYIEFNDNAQEMRIALKYSEDAGNTDCEAHITLIKNSSDNFAVCFMEDETENLLFRVESRQIALALFDKSGNFIDIVPANGKINRFSTVRSLNLDEEKGRVDLICKEENLEKRHQNILSWSYDSDGYFYVTKDKFHPIHCFHPEFDHDIINEHLEWELQVDEYPLYVKSKDGILYIRTNKRLIHV